MDAASDFLTVAAAPLLVKSNSGLVGAGGEVTLTYVVTNTSTEVVSNLTFNDPVPVEIPGVAQVFPSPGFCGASSTMTLAALDVNFFVYLVQGVELPPLGSCSFDVVVTLPGIVGEPGPVEVTSSLVTATLASTTTLIGPQASDTLSIIAGPRLTKEFGATATTGGTVEVIYTITADSSDPAAATNIAFSDAFDSVLPGLVIASSSLPDVCGTGSAMTIDGSQTTMSLTGGTLAPGESCSFSILLSVPVGTVPGVYVSTSSGLFAEVEAIGTVGASATDTLVVDGVQLSLDFPGGPVVPGAETVLRVALENLTTEDASGGFFTLNLQGALSGLFALSLPTTPCGPTSSLSGLTSMVATGLEVPAGGNCTFDIRVLVPVGNAAVGSHTVKAEGLITMALSGAVAFQPALTTLVVADSLMLSTAFIESTTTPGGAATLRVMFATVGDQPSSASAQFSIDLAAALPGLVASGLPLADVCGPGSTVVGTDNLTIVVPSLADVSVCEIDVPLVFPADAPPGSVSVETTSTTNINGAGPGAVATIDVFSSTVVAAFGGPAVAGGITTLGLVLDSTTAASALDLAIDLEAFLPGAVAVGLPQSGLCGDATVEGTSTIILRGAELDGSNPCELSIDIRVPEATAAGVYSLVLSPLTQGGNPIAEAAVPAVLRVEPAPQIGMAVDPDLLSEGATTRLTVTIDNSASVLPATDVSLDVTLPNGVVVAGPTAVTASTCDGGTLTAVAGASSFSLEGAGVASVSTCEVEVNVTGDVGEHTIEPVMLLSSNGSSESGSVTFTVEGAVSVALAPLAPAVFVGGATTVTATLTNPSADRDAESIGFDVVLVGELNAADPLNAETTCGGTLSNEGGTLTFVDGVLVAGETCTLAFDVDGNAVDFGALVTTENGTSSLGPLANTSVAVGVEALPTLSAAFDPDAIGVTSSSELSFTVSGAATLVATDLEFSVVLPDGLDVEQVAPLSDGCVGGDISQSGQTLTFTAESLAAASTCEIRATVQPGEIGVFDIETSALAMSEGEATSAEATLTVTENDPEPDPGPGEPGVEPDGQPGAEPGVEPGAEPGVEPDGEPGQEPEGTPEADPPPDGCGCSASEDGNRSSPIGVLAVLWGIALLRRRRRRPTGRALADSAPDGRALADSAPDERWRPIGQLTTIE